MWKRLVPVVLLVTLVGCGGNSSAGDERASDERGPRTDAAGNPIKAGHDWSGVGTSSNKGSGSGDADANAATASSVLCTPPTAPPEAQEQIESLPPDARRIAEKPFPEPANDFPMEATVSPLKAAPGQEIVFDVLAVGEPGALVVIFPVFSDGGDHGMTPTKFTDETGRAVLKGPVPEDAPEGLVQVAVSVSTRDQESAVQRLQFTVTGSTCR